MCTYKCTKKTFSSVSDIQQSRCITACARSSLMVSMHHDSSLLTLTFRKYHFSFLKPIYVLYVHVYFQVLVLTVTTNNDIINHK